MTMDDIRAELAALLETPINELTDNMPLRRFSNWDSLGMVSLIAFLVGQGQVNINVEKLEHLETVGDLRAFTNSEHTDYVR